MNQIELAKKLLESKGYEVTKKDIQVGETVTMKVDNVDVGYITLDGTEYHVLGIDDIAYHMEDTFGESNYDDPDKNSLGTYFCSKEGDPNPVVFRLEDDDYDYESGKPQTHAKVTRIK